MPFDVEVTTDNNPSETSWELKNVLTGQVEMASPVYTDANTLYRHEYSVPEAQYEFTIFDSGNNGLCCGANGAGSYKVLYKLAMVASGGEFTSSQKATFGSAPGGGPTNAPTVHRGKSGKRAGGKSAKRGKTAKAEPVGTNSTAATDGIENNAMSPCEGHACDRKRVRDHNIAPDPSYVIVEGEE